MDQWLEIARAQTRGGEHLVLRQRGGLFEIRCNGWELMSSRSHYSEEVMAHLACEKLVSAAPRVLIAGLGMGYTLRATLDALPGEARVVVAELVREVIQWNRGPIAHLAGCPFEDTRVTVQCCDVVDLLRASEHDFDLILLDVDNGPDWVMLPGNQSLYEENGLRLIRAALNTAGTLAVWSAGRSLLFEQRLQALGLRWDAVDVAARGAPGDPMHTVYLA
jgi:spermidine synthase